MRNLRLVVREIDRDIFNEIARGSKTIETRAATDKYKSVQVGDSLTFQCGLESVTKSVRGARYFATLEGLYDVLPLAQIMPLAKSVEEAIQTHLSFPGYKEKLATYGIMAFELET